jgi:hypothetical protein
MGQDTSTSGSQVHGPTRGTTTVFATPKDLANFARTHSLATGDNGIGHPVLGKVNTANSFGVAVPKDIMTKLYGGKADDPSTTAYWRTARAQITINGQTYVVPISDLGPGSGPQAAGRVTDFTSYMARGAGWMKDDDYGPVQIKPLPPGSGPDYLTDRKGWNSEQEDLRKQLFRPEPETTPWASPGGIRGLLPPNQGVRLRPFRIRLAAILNLCRASPREVWFYLLAQRSPTKATTKVSSTIWADITRRSTFSVRLEIRVYLVPRLSLQTLRHRQYRFLEAPVRY